jgi:hypothetical protein
MKKLLYFTAMLLLCAGLKTNAQARIPGASTTQTISQDFGLGKIIITYSRPNVNGRKIFGGLQPYGEVWRTGANSATSITFTENVIIEGNKVPAGKYGLFTIPGADEWTIILNKTWDQWGAYDYKQADDIVRFTVKPMKMNQSTETFSMQFANATTQSADLHLMWEKTAVPIHFVTDDDAQIMANIDTLMSGTSTKRPFIPSAQYYYDNGKDMNKALGWVLEYEKLNPTLEYPPVWEARIRLRLGDKQGAITAAQRGVQLSIAAKDDEYIRLNQAVLDKAKGS